MVEVVYEVVGEGILIHLQRRGWKLPVRTFGSGREKGVALTMLHAVFMKP